MENIMIIGTKKSLKKIAMCLTYATLLLQTQAMEETLEANSFLEGKKYNLVGVALFSGADFVSNFVKCSTNSTTSHVGVILADQKNENQWYCFESTGSASEVINGIYPHVHLTDWDSVVKGYDGRVSYRLFVFPDTERPDSDQVTNFVEEYEGKSYTRNPLKLLGALFAMNHSSKSEVLKTVFCSELTAKMLMETKVLKEGTESNYLPKHFRSKHNIDLESGAYLTTEFKAK